MKNRKAFNFYKSYYEVALELENEKDRLDYLMAILNKQFKDEEPKLTGLANFAYISQKHSIESQVQGYKNKSGYEPPTEPPTEPPYLQEQGQGQEQGQEQEKEKEKVQLQEQEKIVCEKYGLVLETFN